jgi:hypothetical protein
MAWPTLITFTAGKQGKTITEVLNEQVRDPMLVLGVHAHDGSAGEGSKDMPSVSSVVLSNQGPPGAAGKLQVDGTTPKWGAGNFDMTQIAAAAGVGSLRTLGDGALQIKPGNHDHI